MPRSKQISPSKRWCFTYNNYPCDFRSSVVPVLSKESDVYVIGQEVGENGTPHLQGYIEFRRKLRPVSLGLDKSIHWEKAKSCRDSNVAYCSKSGKCVSSGVRIPKPIYKMVFSDLKPWQRGIVSLFSEPEDPRNARSVYWFWSKEGGIGKTTIARFLIDRRDAYVLSGKRADIFCAIQKAVADTGECPPIVVLDIPRICKNHASFAAMESLKAGFFFSSKYERGMVRFNPPPVVVFANCPPPEGDEAVLSEDRWRISNITQHRALMRELRGL